MDELLARLTGGGSLAWTLVCLLALAALAVASVLLARRTQREERELRERLASYQRALQDADQNN